MKVTLTLNVGTADNNRLQLPKTAEGSVVEVSDAVGGELVKRGWGKAVEPAKSAAPEVTGEKPEPAKAEPAKPEPAKPAGNRGGNKPS